MKTPMLDLTGVADTLTKINTAYQTTPEIANRTLNDMITRAPVQIAEAVAGVYNIKKSEIKYNKKKIKRPAGYISLHGETLSTLYFNYAGRRLTPTHFDMKPKKAPKLSKKKKHIAYRKNVAGYPDGFVKYPERNDYEISADFKHKRKIFGEKFLQKHNLQAVFLAPSKGKTVIPWMRMSSDPLDIAPLKTLSLPQMVDNKEARKDMGDRLSELLGKRWDHNLKQHFKRCL